MNLRFDESLIQKMAGRYKYARKENEITGLCAQIQGQGCLNKKQLQVVAKWKAPRSAGHVEKNSDEYVKEVTSFAFSSKNERTRIEVLTILNGVSWPTASVLLHLFHKEPYPLFRFQGALVGWLGGS